MKVAFEVKLSSAHVGALKLIRAALSGRAAECEECARVTAANSAEHERHIGRLADAHLQIEAVEAILADYEQHLSAFTETAPQHARPIIAASLSPAAGWASNLAAVSKVLGDASDHGGVPDIAARVITLAAAFRVPPQRLLDAMFSTLQDLPSFLGDVEVEVKRLSGDSFGG